MERKVGEVFTYNGKTYQVVENNSCTACSFANIGCAFRRHIIGNCTKNNRQDGNSVVFKEVNDMKIENNQLTIDIPEGMEIDTENSNLVEGIIKFKTKELDYKTIYNKVCNDNLIIRSHSDDKQKIRAISKLINIARYFNGAWEPNWNNLTETKYYINCKTSPNNIHTYEVDWNRGLVNTNIYFKNKEDAQSIIDNPNFRSILNTVFSI